MIISSCILNAFHNLSPCSKIGCKSELTLSELESPGATAIRINELNDNFESENLVHSIKQTLFQDYACYL
jgi:hypothetical protein